MGKWGKVLEKHSVKKRCSIWRKEEKNYVRRKIVCHTEKKTKSSSLVLFLWWMIFHSQPLSRLSAKVTLSVCLYVSPPSPWILKRCIYHLRTPSKGKYSDPNICYSGKLHDQANIWTGCKQSWLNFQSLDL